MTRSQNAEHAMPGAGATSFPMDRKRPAAQQIYEDLRERIIALELKPSRNLSRQALVDFYRVSQTPIRDAFLMLEQEGLVEIYPQSKTLVARIDVDNARETQFLRTAIELEVTRSLALNADKSQVAEQRLIVEQQRQALKEGNFVAFAELDRTFHRSLCDAAGHPGLWDLIVHRSGHLDRLRRLHLPTPGKANAILSDHAAILDAIADSDTEAASDAVRKHLSGTLSAVDEIVLKYRDYF